MKECTRCHQTKNDDEFSFKNKSTGLRHWKCKSCHKVDRKINYESRKTEEKKRVKLRLKTLVQKFKEYKSTLSCSSCGENHIACLDFHHTDPSQKEDTIMIVVRKGRSWNRVMEEINKCIVLCANCHRKLHYKEDADIV